MDTYRGRRVGGRGLVLRAYRVSLEIGGGGGYTRLSVLTATSMVEMANFMLYIFYHSKKTT